MLIQIPHHSIDPSTLLLKTSRRESAAGSPHPSKTAQRLQILRLTQTWLDPIDLPAKIPVTALTAPKKTWRALLRMNSRLLGLSGRPLVFIPTARFGSAHRYFCQRRAPIAYLPELCTVLLPRLALFWQRLTGFWKHLPKEVDPA